MATETYTKIEINCETGETIEVPLTTEELAERERLAAEAAIKQAEALAIQEAKEAARNSAAVKLAALGLTPEEIAAL